jgi:hypothetical protein
MLCGIAANNHIAELRSGSSVAKADPPTMDRKPELMLQQ